MRLSLNIATLTLAASLLLAPLEAQSGKLTVYPENAVLFGEGAGQHLGLTWTDADGMAGHVRAKAKIELSGPDVARLEQTGLVRAVATGSVRLTASYGGSSASATIE